MNLPSCILTIIPMMRNVKSHINSFSQSPGIYIFKDKGGGVLYVGKAAKLRSRVRSYFSKSSDLSPAKRDMLKKIANIETIATDSENEALILEAIQIKKHKPAYNITLKDDKEYNFIKIDYAVSRPIITTVRRPEIDKGRSKAAYFGPYTSGYALKENLRLLRRIFPYQKNKKAHAGLEQAQTLRKSG